MSTFEEQAQIQAPLEKVWQVLADIGTIAQWNPGVKNSFLTNNVEGIGSSRHCDLPGNRFLDEDVVAWEKNRALTMRVTRTNLPFKFADIRFFLRPSSEGTQITVSPIYELKFGALGRLLDKLFIRRTYEKGMRDLLKGLKGHLEN